MKKKLIIIGGGYAGVRAMQNLKGLHDLEILLVDIQAYHYLQTEVYALIANTSKITDVTVDLPSLCEHNGNAKFLRKKVTNINFNEHNVMCGDEEKYSYDYLIVSSGSYTSFPKVVNGLKEHTVGIKSLKNAFFIKQEFEKQLYSLMSRDIPIDDKHFNIVVGGAGLSGVEIAAQMASKSNQYINSNHIDKYKLNIYLVSSGDSVLNGMNKYLQDKSLARLRKLGVNVLLKTRIQSVESNKVCLNTGQTIDFNYMIFTGGVTTSYYIKELNDCKLCESGQIVVDKTMQLQKHKNVYAIGDVAYLEDKDGKKMPSTAHLAEQSAQIAAKNIKLSLKNKIQKEGVLKADGVLVALGTKNAAVVLFDKFKFSGFLGYMLKSFITNQYKNSLDKDAHKIHKER